LVKGYAALSLGTFPFTLHYAVGLTAVEFVEKLKNSGEVSRNLQNLEQIVSLAGTCSGFSAKIDDGNYVLWLESAPTDAQSIAILAHEAFHITRFLFNYADIGLCDKSDEIWAYQIQYICTVCLENSSDKNFSGGN